MCHVGATYLCNCACLKLYWVWGGVDDKIPSGGESWVCSCTAEATAGLVWAAPFISVGELVLRQFNSWNSWVICFSYLSDLPTFTSLIKSKTKPPSSSLIRPAQGGESCTVHPSLSMLWRCSCPWRPTQAPPSNAQALLSNAESPCRTVLCSPGETNPLSVSCPARETWFLSRRTFRPADSYGIVFLSC